MTLQSGTRLGPYEILASIGAGGMGEVYRARDTRLGRNVAIKILATTRSGDHELQRIRFDREAKAISALNHPHICTLHDVGVEKGLDYFVMEHCEGKTLTRRLADGPLPIDRTLDYAMQIADALDKAHRHGIVHRDLKPSNIMITKSGVKVLDFGLAKDRGDCKPDESTLRQVSEEGALPGTVHYMAPEVLNGREADTRSDIFALGLVMYEMTTGQRAFSETSKAGVIAAILEREPKPVAELRPDAPSTLTRLIHACLAKDPDERIQSAHDVMLELQWSRDGSAETGTHKRRPWIGAAAILAVVALAAVIVALLWPEPSGGPAEIRRFAITLPTDAGVTTFVVGNMLAISPNGKRLVYVGPQGLYLRDLDQLAVKRIPGTEGASGPFFSPDGNWVGFESEGTLKKVELAGGRPTTIRDGIRLRGAVWGSDDRIVFGQRRGSLMRIAASGGAPQPLAPENLQLRWPFALPGGKEVLVTAPDPSGDSDRNDLVLLTLADGKRRTIVRGATYGQYASSGHLLYLHSGTIFGVPFDIEAKKVIGKPKPLLDDVGSLNLGGLAHIAVSGRTIYYVPYDPLADQRQLVWIDRRGHVISSIDKRDGYDSALLSPDGKQILVAVVVRNEADLWRYEIDRGTWIRLTSDRHSHGGIWSPDGRSIVYQSNREGSPNLFTIAADGSGEAVRLTNRATWPLPSSWSPDGKLIAVREYSPVTGQDIWFIPADGKSAAIPWLTTDAEEIAPAFSPDGRWVSYQSSQSGNAEIYVRAVNGKGRTWQVSVSGGVGPGWRSDGKEFFFLQGTAVMAVDVRTSPTILLGKPHILFDNGTFSYWDVTPDGQRFLTIRSPLMLTSTQINVAEGLLD